MAGQETTGLVGGTGDDVLAGNAGADVLVGGEGADLLRGGAGIDVASYEASNVGVIVRLYDNTTRRGHAEGDRFIGIDVIEYTNAEGELQQREVSDIEGLVGSDHGDVLIGDLRDNRLEGGAGNDTLRGDPGDGSGGADLLRGGPGADRLYGGVGDDALEGGPARTGSGAGPAMISPVTGPRLPVWKSICTTLRPGAVMPKATCLSVRRLSST